MQDVRFHDLRHTAASHMVMRGATLKEVQEVLGHRTFTMTLRYSHLSPSHLRALLTAWTDSPEARSRHMKWHKALESRPTVLQVRAEPLAQSVEHLTFNQGVPGSNPGRLTSPFALSRAQHLQPVWAHNFRGHVGR